MLYSQWDRLWRLTGFPCLQRSVSDHHRIFSETRPMAPALLALVFGFNIKLIHSAVDMGNQSSAACELFCIVCERLTIPIVRFILDYFNNVWQFILWHSISFSYYLFDLYIIYIIKPFTPSPFCIFVVLTCLLCHYHVSEYCCNEVLLGEGRN